MLMGVEGIRSSPSSLFLSVSHPLISLPHPLHSFYQSRTLSFLFLTLFTLSISVVMLINVSFLSPIRLYHHENSVPTLHPNHFFLPLLPSSTSSVGAIINLHLFFFSLLIPCVRSVWRRVVWLRKIGEGHPLQICCITLSMLRKKGDPSIGYLSSLGWLTCFNRTALISNRTTTLPIQVQFCHTSNIFSALCICLSSPSSSVMSYKVIEIYKFIQLLMNVRQQHSHIHNNTLTTAMAFPTRSALDTILRNESNSVRFQASSTPSLSNALHLTLAGKLLSAKKPSISNMILFASRSWECPNRLMCYDHGNGIYSFEFINLLDVERVLAGGPWYINGDLLLVDRMDPKLSIEQLPFSETKLWIRCYDLPPMCFNLEFATLIGNGIGRFSDTDLPPEDPSQAAISIRRVPSVRKYLRVKITHNLYTPIKRSQLVEIENPETHLVEELTSRLAYERLPAICYRCGFLGHTIDSCSFSGPTLFGDWIRAKKFYRVMGPEKISTSQEPRPMNISSNVEEDIPSKVTNMAELVSRPDPSIFQVSFKDVRSSGILPPISSKGKQPLIEFPPTSRAESGVIPFAESSSRTGRPLSYDNNGPASSLLGAYPINTIKPLRPSPEINDDSIVIDSEDCNLASYFNPTVPHGDLFSPSTNRCLFRSELVHPAFSTNMKIVESSPKLQSPILKEMPQLDTTMSFYEMLSVPPPITSINFGLNKDESKKGTIHTRKRAAEAAKSVDTPRTKRGRAQPPPDNQA